MTQPFSDTAVPDCLFGTILEFLMPFFLAGAGGSRDVARAAIVELAEVYNATNATELDLVGRIIGFSVAAMDNLRLSMTPDMSDAKVLKYRCNAVTLSRASDQARKILESVQARQEQLPALPRPSVAAAPAIVAVAAPAIVPVANGGVSEFPSMDIETMKRDARIMMQAFSKTAPTSSLGETGPVFPEPPAIIGVAACAGVGAPRRPQSP